MTFGNKLAKMRRENNHTQEQLANILCVSRQTVSKWESNLAYP
jgi:DNA-binding XRE family transcriptional regulator